MVRLTDGLLGGALGNGAASAVMDNRSGSALRIDNCVERFSW